MHCTVVQDVRFQASVYSLTVEFSPLLDFCCISGVTTPAKVNATPVESRFLVKTAWVRIFPTPASPTELPQLRSNFQWQQISHALQNGHVFLTDDNKPHTFGYLGECALTNLAFVDRGTSFVSDTLHSIYHGAFVSVLRKSFMN